MGQPDASVVDVESDTSAIVGPVSEGGGSVVGCRSGGDSAKAPDAVGCALGGALLNHLLLNVALNAFNFIKSEKLAHGGLVGNLDVEDGVLQVGEEVDDGQRWDFSDQFASNLGGKDHVGLPGNRSMENDEEFTLDLAWVVQVLNHTGIGQGRSQAHKGGKQSYLHLSHKPRML